MSKVIDSFLSKSRLLNVIETKKLWMPMQVFCCFPWALLNKSELADRMALYYTCYPILTLCGIPNNVIRFSALTIA
ncbi:hypothetical protein, partial [Sodalis sp. (in: enterobacteria)]|uniref:hypothetical protein n=1 Tax=Sodalis sp. (in: enterobacteria) TaxID=1898979 RepID=UPI003F2F3F6C